MAISVANTEVTNTFEFWRARTNELSYAMSTNVVTTGATTPGTAGVTQNFVANQHISGTGSTNATMNTSSVFITNSTASITYSIPTTSQISNGNYYLSANSSWVYNPTGNTYKSIDGQFETVVDSYLKSQYAFADYSVHVTNRNANAIHITKLYTTHAGDNSNAYITEYSTITSNATAGTLGVFSANANVTHVKLYFTPNVNNTAVKIIRAIV